MQLKRFKTLSISVACMFINCGHAPVVPVCVSDAKTGFDCVDKEKKAYFVPMEKSENWVAFSPEDFKLLLDYYKTKCKEQESE